MIRTTRANKIEEEIESTEQELRQLMMSEDIYDYSEITALEGKLEDLNADLILANANKQTSEVYI